LRRRSSVETKPALTAEEWWKKYGSTYGEDVMSEMWRDRRVEFIGTVGRVWAGIEERDGKMWGREFGSAGTLDPFKLRAVAALCLHDQPFGFTREDVARLRFEAQYEVSHEWYTSLADRIEALLPPKSDDES
jgi:hypothetical protein